MSMVAMKRNSKRFTDPISGRGRDGFSLVGGHRNIGAVGPTNLGRSVTRTPFRGNAPMGHGGCCGQYVVNVCNSGSCCTNDPSIIKRTVKNTAGMLDNKYKWMSGVYPNWWVQDTSPLNMSQGMFIQKVKAEAAGLCGVVKADDAGVVGSSCSSNSAVQWVRGIPHCSKLLAKDPKAAVSSSEYMAGGLLKNKCLPPPASKQPFPFTVVGGNNCQTSYDTWEEAQNDGALPANYVG